MTKSEFLKLQPMLLNEKTNLFSDKNFLYEIKFDGIRSLIFIDKNSIVIKSRNGLILNDLFPELIKIKEVSKKTCIFDGEIVLFNEKAHPDFYKLLDRIHLKNKSKIDSLIKENPAVFMCFDILYYDKDLEDLPLIKRKEILQKIKDTKEFVNVKYINDSQKLWEFIKKENLEGIIAKNKNSAYKYGIRSNDWIKIKNYKNGLFYVSGYIKNKNNTISLILCEKRQNQFIYVGKVLMSNKHSLFKKIISSRKVEKSICNFIDKNATYINEKIKIKVSYLQRTKDKFLRHAFLK